MNHKLLSRQLKQYSGVADTNHLRSILHELSVLTQQNHTSPSTQAFLSGFENFLAKVAEHYDQLNSELELCQRTLALNPSELTQANEQLRLDVARQEEALTILCNTANELLEPMGQHIRIADNSPDELSRILSELVSNLRESDERLRMTLQNAPDAVFITEQDGSIVYVNDNVVDLLGYIRDELYSMSVFDLVPPDWRDSYQQGAQKMLSAQMKPVMEIRLLTKNGSKIPMEMSAALLPNGRVYGSCRDIREHKVAQKALKNSQESLQRMMSAMAEGMYGVDTDGRCTFVNTSFLRILGYDHENEVIGKHIHSLIHHSHPDGNPYPAKDCLMYQSFKRNKPVMADNEVFWHKNGNAVAVEYYSQPINKNGKVIGAVATFLDITKRKAAEAKVIRITKIYEALNKCNQAIKRCTSRRELFDEICLNAVEFGGMRMSWIGNINDATGLVDPVASYGYGIEYINKIEISTDIDKPSGKGTTGTSIRENRPVWIQDFQKDPRLAPWHERGKNYGWGGVAALPLHVNGKIFGAMMLYTDTTDAFDDATQNLLVEMAENIDVALDKMILNAEHQQVLEALQESEASIRSILDSSMEAVISTDQSGKVLLWNHEAEKLFGYTAAQALNKDVAMLIVPPLHRVAHRHGMQRFITTGKKSIIGKRIEITGMRADGSEIEIELTLSSAFRNGSYFFNSFARDISERKKIEENLRITAATFDAQEAILITDQNANILRANRSFEAMTGYQASELAGKNPSILKSGQHDDAYYEDMWTRLNKYGKWSGEIWDKRKNGEVFPQFMTITAVYDQYQMVTHYVSVSRDITQRKLREQEIHQLAFYDPLTKLPNRRLFLDRLQRAIATGERNSSHGALIFMDLDHFKTINDTQGHEIGDQLLIEAARRLLLCVREGDTVARLGGDEFVIALQDMSKEADEAAAQAKLVAEKIQHELGRTYELKHFECTSTASIGIVIFKGHQEKFDALLKNADTAMYQAKAAGRNIIRFYDPAMQAALELRIKMESELRQALKNDQFKLYYQIQVDHLHRPQGAEVLLRWDHPEQGIVSPAQFIGLAEETGLISPIGLWVLKTACEQLFVWQADEITRNLTLSVNVSAKQFHQVDFVSQIQSVLHETGAKPSLLKLELTESTTLANVEDTIAKMRNLKLLGIGFSMDDFGTGYSSLQYLKRLPLDQIKIDQEFVRDLASDPNDAAIVKTIIAMTSMLGLDVIAEGVETDEQLDFLNQNGCHAFQGFLFSRPIPIDQLDRYLHEEQ